MIAILIIIVSMVAFLTSMTVAIRTSTNNEFRDVSTKVANATGETLLALPMNDSDLSTDPTSSVCTSHSRIPNDSTQNGKGLPNTTQVVRGSQVPFTIQWCVSSLSSNTTSTTIIPSSVKIEISVAYVSRQTYTTNSVIFKQTAI